MPGEVAWNSTQILMMPALFSVLGFFSLILGWISFKNSGDMPKWRWISLVLFVVGFFFGFSWFWRYVNPSVDSYAYRTTITTRFMVAAHYVAPVIPLILIIIYFVMDQKMKKAAQEQAG